jgi:D-arabinose 1-dehydrogenase-like Zn-dependent alcohol dehydrogenase
MVGLVNYAQHPHSVELRELPVPAIGEEDVLFKVEAVGICGSDLHQYTGKQGWKVNYPVVLGHPPEEKQQVPPLRYALSR